MNDRTGASSALLTSVASHIPGRRSPFFGNYLGLVLAILLLGVFLSFASPFFLSASNFVNIGNQIAVNIIIAVGMTLIITAGGIDLSVGSNLAVTGVTVALFLRSFGDLPGGALLGLLVGIGVGLAIGLINASLVSLLSIPAFITTLGMMVALRGLALIISNGRVVSGLPTTFEGLFAGFIWGFPKPVLVALLVVLVCAFILNKTPLGRVATAIGGNERCVEVCGLSVRTYKYAIYGIGAICAAVSGMTLTSMMDAAEPIAGNFYELDAVAVVVMGGTDLNGGRSTILGTVLGALLLGMVRNGLNLMEVPAYYHQLMVGVVILLAVVLGSREKG